MRKRNADYSDESYCSDESLPSTTKKKQRRGSNTKKASPADLGMSFKTGAGGGARSRPTNNQLL
jgi:hypothetical protein